MPLSRSRPTLIAALFTLLTIGLVWGPSYARGLSLVARAAHPGRWVGRLAVYGTHTRALSLVARAARLGGWIEGVAVSGTPTWRAEPATTIPTRHGAIPARLY